MAIYTYVRNDEPKDDNRVIRLRNGSLEIEIGQYANLTEEEIREINNNTVGIVIEPGIVGEATNAE